MAGKISTVLLHELSLFVHFHLKENHTFYSIYKQHGKGVDTQVDIVIVVPFFSYSSV